jgi:hypothetical protein
MPRVGEFCAANISRLLLGVAIVILLLLSVSYWMFYLPGRPSLVKEPVHSSQSSAPSSSNPSPDH